MVVNHLTSTSVVVKTLGTDMVYLYIFYIYNNQSILFKQMIVLGLSKIYHGIHLVFVLLQHDLKGNVLGVPKKTLHNFKLV